MHRFYMPPEQCGGPIFSLAEREAHHASQVLRARPGDQVTVLNGSGGEYLCEIVEVTKRSVKLRIKKETRHESFPWQITLAQAIPKGKTFDTIVQKATELGAFRIIPLLTERVVVHVDNETSESKVARWEQNAIEAIKQCGSPWLPKINAPVSFAQALQAQSASQLGFIASLAPGSSHPRQYFSEYAAQNQPKLTQLSVWVGPEGDFTPAELDAAQQAGLRPITLGPLVLRSDTAAIYCLSVLNYELQALFASHSRV